jgi:hypothetical protein
LSIFRFDEELEISFSALDFPDLLRKSRGPPVVTASTPAPVPCEASSVTTVNGKSAGCKSSIIFNEDFNSDNLKYWSYDTRFPLDDGMADAEFNVYERRPETSYIRDGMLTIRSELLTKLPSFDDTRVRVGKHSLQER